MEKKKSYFWPVVIALAVVYALREFLAGMSLSFVVPMDRLLFISHGITPVAMWMLLGLLVGTIYGSFVAIKKYRLDMKLIVIPIGILVLMINLILLISYLNEKWAGDIREEHGPTVVTYLEAQPNKKSLPSFFCRF